MAIVLIVDDYLGTREMFSAVLRRAGHETAIAATGQEGVGIATARSFDVILIDYRLADGISGVDVVRTLRHSGVTSRLVIFTGFPDVDLPFAAGSVGADGCIEGALWDEEIIHVVNQALSGPFPVRHPALRRAATDELGRLFTRDPLVQSVKSLIDEALHASPSVSELAAQGGCSESTLRHRFHKSVGLSITKYRTERRVQESATKLVTTLQTVREIAYAVGYRSLSLADFRQDFRRRFGMSPREYRARFWRGSAD
jgi:AraC-like DNA-binding protein